MRNLEELNLKRYGKSKTIGQPTSVQLDYVESLVGAKLPHTYVNFLMFSNGGCPELDTYYFDFESKTRSRAINCFLHISSDPNSTGDIVWNYNHRWQDAPQTMLPIADDGVGNLICFDLSEPAYGAVVLWVHDPPDPPLITVASSFEEFIDSLTRGDDDV